MRDFQKSFLLFTFLLTSIFSLQAQVGLDPNAASAVEGTNFSVDSFRAPSGVGDILGPQESLFEAGESQNEFETLFKGFLEEAKEPELHPTESLVSPSEFIQESRLRRQSSSTVEEEKEGILTTLEEVQPDHETFLKEFRKEWQKIEIDPKAAIVEKNEQVSDFEARFALAVALSYSDEKLEEALHELFILRKKDPENPLVHLELGKIYLRQEKEQEANDELNLVLKTEHLKPNLLIEVAIQKAALGYIKESQCLFERAIDLAENKQQQETFVLDYAGTMLTWGDFYCVEKIYLKALEKNPDSDILKLKLALTYIGEQRFEEAEQILYLLLLYQPNNEKILVQLIELKILQKEFEAALELSEQLEMKEHNREDLALIKGTLFFQDGRLCAALDEYKGLLSSKHLKKRVKALIQIARIYQKQGKFDQATPLLELAKQQDPHNREIDFYLLSIEERLSDCFLQDLINSATSPRALVQWADFYLQNGWACPAIRLFHGALFLDENYFFARLGLAQALSVFYHYKEPIQIYLGLLEEFPDNPRLLLELSRVTSWDKQYCRSLELYEQLIEMNPLNPVPIREMARVAFWSKRADLAMEIFNQLLCPKVDTLLLEEMAQCEGEEIDEICGSLFASYEEQLEKMQCENFPTASKEILLKHWALYRIQKAVSLESSAKWLVWNKRYIHALPLFEELIEFMPGNQEALFDYAQVLDIVGECQKVPPIYRRLLLYSNNLYTTAKTALRRSQLFLHPALISNYSFWHEFGAVQLSDISRQRWSVGVEVPIDCRSRLRYFQNRWLEHAYFPKGMFWSKGSTFEVEKTFSPYVRSAASISQKVYDSSKVSSKVHYLGFANLWFNRKNYYDFGIGFERAEELPNYFAVVQSIRTNIFWCSLQSNLTRFWRLEGTYRYITYSDRNTQYYSLFTSSYQLTESPRIFKLSTQLESRNAQHLNEFIFKPLTDQLITIIHPYWTPRHYHAGRIILEYWHDLAPLEFYENEKRFFDMQLMVGTDTDNNPASSLTLQYHYEFLDKWIIDFITLIYRSNEWDAEGAWATIQYRF